MQDNFVQIIIHFFLIIQWCYIDKKNQIYLFPFEPLYFKLSLS